MIFAETIYKLGAKKRNPTLAARYGELKASEKASREELEAIQLRKLKRLIALAYEKTAFYRRLFDERGLTPDDFNSLDDLQKLPILDKETVRARAEEMRVPDCGPTVYSETSGTTGTPFVFYKSEEWDSAARAAQMRGYSWYGVAPWDRNGYLWGRTCGAGLKTRLSDALVNRFRLFSYDADEVARFARKLRRADYLEGYSSMIYNLAKEINARGLGPVPLKMIKGTSDKVFESYQSEVERAFGGRMINEYGASETGLIAYECPHGHMHVAMENVIVEVDDGDAVITNLHSTSMPLIRYRLGDRITLDRETRCPCGMAHEIIGEVSGRIGATIFGREGKYPGSTVSYIVKSMVVKLGSSVLFQGVQEEKGKLTLCFDRPLTPQERSVVDGACAHYFGGDVEVTVTCDPALGGRIEKFRYFISRV